MMTIVDFGAGNLRSVANMFTALGVASEISADASVILAARRLVLPGVGHFSHGMQQLVARGLDVALRRRVLDEGIPILGICLGAQLMTKGSAESNLPGLGWLDARAIEFDRARLGSNRRVPHMEWTDTSAARALHPFTPLPLRSRYYFVHSYHIACENSEDVLLTADYGMPFVAGFQRGNVLGVQFHPEKSHSFGMAFLRAFADWQPARSDR
jgi:imidazole glycerol-phosphate synthase subunit HisH